MKFADAFPESVDGLAPIAAHAPPLEQFQPRLQEVVHLFGCHNCRDLGLTLEPRPTRCGYDADYAVPCPRCEYGEAYRKVLKSIVVDTATKQQRRERNKQLGWGGGGE